MKRPPRSRVHSSSEHPQKKVVRLKVKLSPSRLRIVAGSLGGRKIDYNGDPVTRPMKERTREAVFSLLGGRLDDTWIVDLFAGTGILAFESISRGAEKAVALELARAAVITMRQNMELLDILSCVDIHNVDTLRWLRSAQSNTADWPALPWVVFCCPPYRMWTEDGNRLIEGIQALYELSPQGSRFVCETEQSFDIVAAIPALDWDVRSYAPANIAIAEKDAPLT